MRGELELKWKRLVWAAPAHGNFDLSPPDFAEKPPTRLSLVTQSPLVILSEMALNIYHFVHHFVQAHFVLLTTILKIRFIWKRLPLLWSLMH